MLEPCEEKFSCTVLRGEDGSNVVDLLDRPSDITQREGRILRQGNKNPEISIFRYVTKKSFDSFSWQTVENKARFIGQVMNGSTNLRKADDIDSTALSFEELKVIASDNPLVKKKMELDLEVSRLQTLESVYRKNHFSLQSKLMRFPNEIADQTSRIENLKADIVTRANNVNFNMSISDKTFNSRKESGEALVEYLKTHNKLGNYYIGQFNGFELELQRGLYDKFILKGHATYSIELGESSTGNITRLVNAIDNIANRLDAVKQHLKKLEKEFESTKIECAKPFEHHDLLLSLRKTQAEINSQLDLDKKDVGEIAVVEETVVETSTKTIENVNSYDLDMESA